MFKRNEGILDRIVRVVLGVILLPIGLFVLGGSQASPAGIVTAAIGTIALVTGISGVCLPYNLFGFSTLEKERAFMARFRSMASRCMSGTSSGAGRMCWPGAGQAGEPHNPQT